MALVFGSTTAKAQHWFPADMDFTAWSGNVEFEYHGVTIACDESEMSGNTSGGNQMMIDEAVVEDLWFGPDSDQDCSASAGTVADVSVDMDGGWPLWAVDPTGGGNGAGELEVPDGLDLVITTAVLGLPLCEFQIEGEQRIETDFVYDSQQFRFGKHRDAPDADNIDVTAHDAGMLQCPHAAAGKGTFSATYEIIHTDPNTEMIFNGFPAWFPANLNFNALAGNPKLVYGGTTVECDESAFSGNTSGGGANPAESAALDDFWLGPAPHDQNCSASIADSEVTDVPVTIDPPDWRLWARFPTGGGDGIADLQIPSDGEMEIEIDLPVGDCTLEIIGMQFIRTNFVYNTQRFFFGSDRDPADTGNVSVSRTGDSTCGPAFGAGTLSGTYVVSAAGDAEVGGAVD